MSTSTHPTVVSTTVLAGVLAAGMLSAPPGSAAQAQHDRSDDAWHRAPESSQVVLDWERTAFRTVFAEAGTPIPSGAVLLGFTSLAMHHAVTDSLHRGRSSETAAAATAAHDVLQHYVPASQANLDADLATSLAAVTPGPAKVKGARLGAEAAAELLASRVGDGFGDPTIHYSKAPGPGVWQPTPPATDMLVPWLGSLDPLVLHHAVRVNGPDALTSAAYAADYNEVRTLGSSTSAARTQQQTDTALFFNSNSATMVGDALVRYLESAPRSLPRTALIFAVMHASMSDAIITCWRLKRDVGFWRPSQAIAGAADDGNPQTMPEAGWSPLVPNPPYSDYVSGHGCLTGPAVETVRRMLGERTPLELRSVNSPTPRVYPTLTMMENDALHARIWSGLHFRDAMDDAYLIGHETARRVLHRLAD